MQLRKPILLCLVTAVSLYSTIAFSTEKTLNSEQISQFLADRKIEGNQNGMQWEQTFKSNGETYYFEKKANRPPSPSPGLWRAADDMYCSQWPPSNRWDCYRFTAEGDALTFIPANGGEPWPAVRLPQD